MPASKSQLISGQSKVNRPRRLPMMDASFLQTETRETPTHIASLQIFQLPKDAGIEFIKTVVDTMRGPEELGRPWNLKLAPVFMSGLAPAMVETTDIDMTYHVRHTCLPSPGGERELGELVSHLHSTLLDRSRPLWTCHVIEGLENNRFALYIKIHHALMDGITGTSALTGCLGTEPQDSWSPAWAAETVAKNTPTNPKATPVTQPDNLRLRHLPRSIAHIAGPLIRLKGKGQSVPIRLPFTAPTSPLNTPITGARRVATQLLPLNRVKALAKQTNASLNDIFLAICSSALRRHLLDSNSLPTESLVAGVPVSLRTENTSHDAGNAVGLIWSVLGTEYADPLERLQAICKSTKASKD